MGLPSGNPNSPLFSPTPTAGAMSQLGGQNPANLQGQGQFQQQPNPFDALAQQGHDPAHFAPFNRDEMTALRNRFQTQIGGGMFGSFNRRNS